MEKDFFYEFKTIMKTKITHVKQCLGLFQSKQSRTNSFGSVNVLQAPLKNSYFMSACCSNRHPTSLFTFKFNEHILMNFDIDITNFWPRPQPPKYQNSPWKVVAQPYISQVVVILALLLILP